MAAAPFTGTVILRGNKSGVKHYRVTMSDVNAAYWVFPDGNGFVQLPSTDDTWTLVDSIIVTGGTDTTQSLIYASGLSTGVVVDHKSNLNTANFRQFITNPIMFKGGALIRFQQLT